MSKKNRKQVFFDEDTPHGLVKRLMLKKYLQAYIEKTQNKKFTLKTVYIDGFAGVGRYGNEWPSEIEKYGSPLIALMVSLGFYYKHDMKKQKEDKKDKTKMPNTHERYLLENRNEETGRSKACASVKAGNKSTDKSGDEEKHEQPTNTERKQDSIWGWSTSELEPEDELPIELGKRNKRSEVFEENANITLHFIESDIKNYIKLAANVELLIMKFLERHYQEYEYGFRQTKGYTLFNICTGSFYLTIKVFHQEFGKTPAPWMLRDSSVRSLTFLDPYGFKDTPMAHVQQFAPGPGNEILINFMSSFVNRFVSKSHEHVLQLYGIPLEVAKYYGIDQSDGEENEDKLVEFVKRVIHFSQPQKEFSNNINKCARNYEDFLKKKINCKYSSLFELKDKQNTTLFHMVHVTNHVRGIEAMKESMNRCSQKEGEMVMSDYDVICKGQNLNFVNMDDNEKVAEMIYSQFRGKERVPISDINDYVLLDTNYVFRKSPLNILQRSGKITTAVNNLKIPQRIPGKFPDRDNKTKQALIWYISFADEEYRSESADGPDVGVQNLIKEVKESKKKSAKKNQNNTDMPSSTRTEEQEDAIEKEFKKTKENKGNGNKRGLENELNIINEKHMKRQKGDFRDINTNINGATPLLVTEIDNGANEPKYGSLTHEQKDEGEVEKDTRIKAIRQSSLTDTFKVLKRPKELNAGEVHKQEGHKRKKSK